MPLYLRDKLGTDRERLTEYCREQLGLVEPDVRMERIKIQSLVKWNGFYLYISGKSNNQLRVKNGVALCLNRNWMTYIKGVEKTAETEGAYSLVTAEKNLELYDVLTEKHRAGIYSKRPTPVGKKLVRARDKFEQLEVREQCKVILQILQLSQLSNLGADLRLVGESKNTGVSMISKNVTDAEVLIGGKREYVNNAIKIYCRSIFDALNDNDLSQIKFYRNEL